MRGLTTGPPPQARQLWGRKKKGAPRVSGELAEPCSVDMTADRAS